MSSNLCYVNYQLNGTQCANYQFKMAAKYSKWRPKLNDFNWKKKKHVSNRIEHVYEFRLLSHLHLQRAVHVNNFF